MANTLGQPFKDPLYLSDSRVFYQGDEFRQHLGLFTPGVRDATTTTATPPNGGSFGVNQHAAGANMTVDVNAGLALVQGGPDYDSTKPWLGMYGVETTGTTTVSTTSGDATQTRYDIVVIELIDSGLSTGTINEAQLLVVRGTPGFTAPTVATGQLLLATITVPANATSITNANITDNRKVFSSAAASVGAGLLDYQSSNVVVTSPYQASALVSVPLLSSTVTVPASGKLLFRISCMLLVNGTFGSVSTPFNGTASFQMSEDGTLLGASELVYSGANYATTAANVGGSVSWSYLATGLTAGTQHTFALNAWLYGASAQGGTGMEAYDYTMETWQV